MSKQSGLSLEEFRVLVERVGFHLSPQELEKLKPLYERAFQIISVLHETDFGPEEMALSFSPEHPPHLRGGHD